MDRAVTAFPVGADNFWLSKLFFGSSAGPNLCRRRPTASSVSASKRLHRETVDEVFMICIDQIITLKAWRKG